MLFLAWPSLSETTGRGKAGRRRHTGMFIGEDRKIDTDGDLNVIVFKRTGKSWRPDSYVSRLDQALRYLMDQQVRKSDLDKLEALKREIVGVCCVELAR